jgi:hypothetical protein
VILTAPLGTTVCMELIELQPANGPGDEIDRAVHMKINLVFNLNSTQKLASCFTIVGYCSVNDLHTFLCFVRKNILKLIFLINEF